MRSKILLGQTPLLILLAVLVISMALLISFIPKDSFPRGAALLIEKTIAPLKQEEPMIPLPMRLRIPAVNVDAAIEQAGLAINGTMGTPQSPADTVWFNLGPRPGETGSAVIAGHFGWKEGRPAVFDNLHQLQKGDKLFVEDEKGATIVFVVRELRIYYEDQDASDVFSSSDGKAHLNLITCEGIWDSMKKSYSNRLVLFTDREYENIQ